MRRSIIGAVLVGALLSCGAAFAAQPQTGKIVFASNRANAGRDLYVVNRDGTGLRRLTVGVFTRAPQWSPTANRIAFAVLGDDGNWDIYTIAPDGSHLTRLTTAAARDDYPSWTADGRIVWQSDPSGSFACPCNAWIMNADGSGKEQLDTSGDAFAPSPAPNGNRIVFGSDVGRGTEALFTMQLNGRARQQITEPAAGTFGDFQPRWAPNGNDIAFLRDSTGADNDIFVVHSDGTGLRRLTDTPGRPEFGLSWAADRSELVFFAQDGDVSHLYAMQPNGGGESKLSTTPRAPYTDTFDGNAVDTSFWYTLTDPGSALALQNGQLVESIAGSAV